MNRGIFFLVIVCMVLMMCSSSCVWFFSVLL